jgi:hypothetical protein
MDQVPGHLVHLVEVSRGLGCKMQPRSFELSRHVSPSSDGIVEPMEDASQEQSMDRERMQFCRRELVLADVLANKAFRTGLDVKAKDGEHSRRRMDSDKA